MRQRSQAVLIRLTPKEKTHLKKQAAASGLSVETFVRKLIMGIEIYPRPPDEVRAIISAINRVGNNINQIARKVNITDTVSYDELVNIKRQLADLIVEVKR